MMAFDWTAIFDNFGVKRVSATDKTKAAYVPNEQQKAALAAAGLQPTPGGGTGITHPVEILFDPDISLVQASYYLSIRAGANRTPEPRIGQGLIQWAQPGDQIVIGNIGARVLAARQSADQLIVTEAGRELAKKLDPARIYTKAKQATGKPERRTRIISDFRRDLNVVAAALLRSKGQCELPDCEHPLFMRDDGAPYLEVHHVTPLGEDGDDTLVNTAAICPSCHRELHYGRLRHEKRKWLAIHVAGIIVP